MENYIARAFQVSLLNENALQSLHKIEDRLGHRVVNWNIQEIFKLPAIRETYDIPEDHELQAIHSMRVTKEIKAKVLPSVETSNDSMEWMHAFDWAVFHKKDEIVWQFAGTRGSDRRFQKAVSALKSLVVMLV